MAEHALRVEPVSATQTPLAAGERRSTAHSTALFWWQIALLAARAGALERELEHERRRHERVLQRYERLLAQRDEEIVTLREEVDEDRSYLAIRSLLSQYREAP